MAQNYYTLDKVIRGLLLKSGEDSEHKYALYNLYAQSFLEDFKNDSAREVRTIRLPMATDRSVMLPEDYIDWVKVGTESGDRISAMSYNQDLNKLEPLTTVTASMLNYVLPDGTHIGDVSTEGSFRSTGDFSVDYTHKIMRFHSTVSVQDIYLEYLSSKVEGCGETPIHPYAKAALENYIKWQEALFKGRFSEARELERLYYTERRKVNGRMSPFSLDMMMDIISRSFNSNVR